MKKLLKKLILLVNKLLYIGYPVQKLPHSQLLILKYAFYQKILGFNRDVKWPVHRTSQFLSPEKINPGSRTPGLAHNCFIDARNGIEIGKNVWIAHGVNLISQNHDNNEYSNYIIVEKIKIGDNCLIGANAVILPEVQLGNHTIVAAGAIVTKSFCESNQIIAGNPAKIIKKIGEYKCAE